MSDQKKRAPRKKAPPKPKEPIEDIEDTEEKILKPHILTRILFYIDNKHINKYNQNFNNQIINKFSLINTAEITHPKKENVGITLSLNGLLTEEYFNNITNHIIKYFNDDSIILKYRSGRENEDIKYTFSNIK